MKNKFFTLKNFFFIFFFTLFFIVPHFIQYYKIGVFIPGDNFFYKGIYIENLSNLKIYLEESFFKSLNVIKNPIFIFFIAGALFQKIIKIIREIS